MKYPGAESDLSDSCVFRLLCKYSSWIIFQVSYQHIYKPVTTGHCSQSGVGGWGGGSEGVGGWRWRELGSPLREERRFNPKHTVGSVKEILLHVTWHFYTPDNKRKKKLKKKTPDDFVVCCCCCCLSCTLSSTWFRNSVSGLYISARRVLIYNRTGSFDEIWTHWIERAWLEYLYDLFTLKNNNNN